MSKLHPSPPQDYDNVNFPFLLSLENILHFFFTAVNCTEVLWCSSRHCTYSKCVLIPLYICDCPR